MRKNKKLFAILTLVAFMMTLMPVLAFATAPTGEVAVSSLTVTGQNKITLTAADKDHIGIYATDGTNYTSSTPAKPIVTASGAGPIEIDASGLAASGHWAIVKANNADPTVATTNTVTNTADFTTENLAKAYYNGKALTGTVSYGTNGKATITTSANADLYLVTSGEFADASGVVTADSNATTFTTDAAVSADAEFILVPTGTVKDLSGTSLPDTGVSIGTGATTVKVSKHVAQSVKAYKDYNDTPNATTIDAFVTAYDGIGLTEAAEFTRVSGASEATVNNLLNAKAAKDAYTAYKADQSSAAKLSAFKTAYGKTSSAVFGEYIADATETALAAQVAVAANVYDAMNVFAGGTTLNAALTAWNAFYATPNVTTWNNFKDAYEEVNANDFAAAVGNKSSLAINVYNAENIGEATRLIDVDKASGGSGTGGAASVEASILATAEANATTESNASATTANSGAWLDTKYAELDLVFNPVVGQNGQAQDVYIWAEESGKSGQATDAFVLNMGTVESNYGTHKQNVYLVTPGDGLTNGANTLKAAFLRGGTYTIKASFVNPTKKDDGTTTLAAGQSLTNVPKLKSVSNKTTITVTSPAQESRLFTIDVVAGTAKTVIDTNLGDGKTTVKSVAVAADTVATTKVTITVKNKTGNLMTTYPVKLSTNSANIELDKTSVSTDYKGEASFNVAGVREGEYKIYVSIGDYEGTIMVQVGATSANDIQLIKFPSNPIATDTLVADYKDIFRFQLTDANGNIVTGHNPRGARYASLDTTVPSSEKTTAEMAKYAYIVSAPEANKVKNADLKLLYVDKPTNKDYYTLGIDNNKAFEAEGDYEIRVVLDNGKSATLNFSVKKFDKATSLHIEYPTSAVELNSTTAVPDIYFLDANNVMKKANNRVIVAAQGYAVASVEKDGDEAGKLTIKNDEKYVGQTITVTAASDKENLMASTTLTVADQAREVKLDTNRGPVNANNRVGFKVIDSTGNAVALGNDATVEITAVVTNTGDADAKVSYSVTSSSKADLREKGTGIINLSANKQTTATVQIMVKVEKPLTNADDNNTGLSTTYYSGTETFTFGAEADKSVVMTIGSKEIVAQNVPVTIDVAPFIQDNRTYVPFRALVEAFGAEVDYNADNNTVTTKLDGKTVVLTVGSTVLTVNDETVTMDVAPFIVDDRVVVPVRFVGEAFGFTVEATQDADTGATASVVFYQK